jgi:integrase
MRLLKPAGSRTWSVVVTSESGKEHTIDLGVSSRDEALELVSKSKVEELEKAAKVTRLTSDVVSLIVADKNTTIRQASRSFCDWLARTHRSNRTRINTEEMLECWARIIGDKPVASITEDDINKFVNPMNDQTKRGTRQLRLGAIHGVMNYCLHERILIKDVSRNVRVNMRIIEHDKKETTHKSVMDEDEIEFLVSKASGNPEPPSLTPGFFKAAIIIARDMALRLGDICNLEWDSVDFATKTMTVWTSKGGSRVELPMTRRVISVITGIKNKHKQYMFPNEREIANDPKKRAMLSVYFSRFFDSVGIEGYSFHSLRATYATTMANKGYTMEQIAEALGHKSTTVTKAYVRNPGAAKVENR